jgi:hypothetical protein
MPDAAYIEVQVGGHYANCRRRGVALVDVADAEAISAYRWSMHSNRGYAVRMAPVGGKQRLVLMHRFLLGLGLGDPDVDHINGDTLDNRRENLRVCTHAQNQQNLHERPHRGTTWDAHRSRWKAQVMLAGKNHFLGRFDTREEAAEVAAAFRREHMPYSVDARHGRAEAPSWGERRAA